MNEEPSELSSFWDHLDELRSTLIKIAWIVLIGTTTAFIFHQPILHFLTKPLQTLAPFHHSSLEAYDVKIHRSINTGNDFETFELPEGGSLKYLSPQVRNIGKDQYYLPPHSYVDWEQAKPAQNLLILGPIEGFSMSLKISLWLGLAGTSPLWLYFIFQFIAPALHQREKLLALPFFGLSLLFISLGVYFAYVITIPLANGYFFTFNENLGLNLWSFTNYIDYTLLLILSNAVAFELFAAILLLVHYGFLKAQMMKDKRKHVIVAAFILGALLTPPDVLSQLLMAIPMIILYEFTIFYASFRESLSLNSDAN